MAEALLLNPIVVPPALSSNMLAAQQIHSCETAESLWYGNMKKLAHIKGVGFFRRELLEEKRLPTGTWVDGTIHRVSFSGSHPVISWYSGGLTATEPWYLSALDLNTGRCMWNRTVGRGKLFFATPRLVIFQPAGSNEQFTLFDLETGSHLTDMDADYFGTVFCPGYDTLGDSQSFTYSNVDMTVDMTWLKEAIGTSSSEYSEKKTVMDPFGSPTHYVSINNIWGGRGEGLSWRPDI